MKDDKRWAPFCPPIFVALYKSFVSSEKLGIQIWQNPAICKNSQICLLEVGVSIKQAACFFECSGFFGLGRCETPNT
jgi:hypothetical protein